MDDDRPPAGGPASLSVVRAAVVLVVFVVAVVVLVDVGTRSSVTSASSAAPTTTTTTTTGTASGSTTTTTAGAHATTTTTTSRSRGRGHGAATTTTTTAPHNTVSVVVANATSANGLAAHFSTVIGAGGWSMGTPIDANSTEATSAVYYATGEQEAAASIATTIGVQPTQVLPLSSATPVSYPTGTDVVVVIGEDLASTSGA